MCSEYACGILRVGRVVMRLSSLVGAEGSRHCSPRLLPHRTAQRQYDGGKFEHNVLYITFFTFSTLSASSKREKLAPNE